MGLYLSKPEMTRNSQYVECDRLRYAFSQVQGWKIRQDDILVVRPQFDQQNSLFAILEIHGGVQYGKYLEDRFIQHLMEDKEYQNKNYDLALKNTYENIDHYLSTDEGQNELKKYDPQEHVGSYGGATALVVLLTEENVYVANAGISRCVCQFEGKYKTMSTDHYSSNEFEKQRILQAGGEVWEGRVNAHLPFSRTIGDYEFKRNPRLEKNKQMVIPTPSLKYVEIAGTEMVLMGSSGFWKTWTNEGITDVIMERVNANKPLLEIIDAIIDSIVAPSVDQEFGLDNVTCVLIAIKKNI